MQKWFVIEGANLRLEAHSRFAHTNVERAQCIMSLKFADDVQIAMPGLDAFWREAEEPSTQCMVYGWPSHRERFLKPVYK